MSFMVSATAYSITMPSNQVTKVSGSYRADTPGKGRTLVQRGQRPLWGVGQDGFVFMVWGKRQVPALFEYQRQASGVGVGTGLQDVFCSPKGHFTQTGIWSAKGEGRLETGANLVLGQRGRLEQYGWVRNIPVGGLTRVEVSRPTSGQVPGQEPRVGIW